MQPIFLINENLTDPLYPCKISSLFSLASFNFCFCSALTFCWWFWISLLKNLFWFKEFWRNFVLLKISDDDDEDLNKTEIDLFNEMFVWTLTFLIFDNPPKIIEKLISNQFWGVCNLKFNCFSVLKFERKNFLINKFWFLF